MINIIELSWFLKTDQNLTPLAIQLPEVKCYACEFGFLLVRALIIQINSWTSKACVLERLNH